MLIILYKFQDSSQVSDYILHNDLCKLLLDTYHWSEGLHSSQSEWPICKVGFNCCS